MSQDPLADYASKMREVRPSDKLRARVLKQEQTESLGKHAVAAVRIQHPHTHTSKKAASRYNRALPKALGMAACLALVVVGVGFATGAFSLPSSGTADQADTTLPNSFTLMAYAAENSGESRDSYISYNASDFTKGGYSGAYYDPNTKQFWAYDKWAGYKFAFDLNCIGQNIKNVSYTIEGDHAYFETMPGLNPSENIPEGFCYTSSVTLDYEHQQSVQDDKITSIYLGFPVPQSAAEITHQILAGTADDNGFYATEYLLDVAAAQSLSQCHLILTATFVDGSTQTKSFMIKPHDGFEQELDEFWKEEKDHGPREKPAIFTIQELSQSNNNESS